MQTLTKSILITIACVLISACSVNPKISDLPIKKTEIVSFKTVAEDVSRLNSKYGESNVLIVLDIDNTLLTSSVDIGGDIWYQWQRGKLAIKPDESQKVACLFEDSIGLLYELLPMNLTERKLPEIIEQWQSAGNTVFALTSRAPKYRSATERELNNKGIDFEIAALSPAGKGAPIYRETSERELSYMKGVMMTSGMNKGEMLDFILSKTERTFDAFVFVDDSEKNIVNVYQKYKGRNDIDRNLYHYVNVEKSREAEFGSVLTAAQATNMANDWIKLNKTLKAIFPKRHLSEGCLSSGQ